MGDLTAADNAVRTVWLFGHPVAHSLSPRMQNAAFIHAGLDLRYVARDVEVQGLATAVAELRSPWIRGANVTLPHKQAIVSLLDQVEPRALEIGAVNTIVNDGGRLIGHNTDAEGFIRALATVLPRGPGGLACLVFGAGGAARAVVAALQGHGAATVMVANRTRERAESLCREASAWGGAACVPLGLGDVRSVVDDCGVIINATSLGITGSVKDLPVDVDTLHNGQVLVDLVYSSGPDPTSFIRAAQGGGLVAIDGKEMLVQQAALSFSLWTGMEAPLDVMRGSLNDS